MSIRILATLATLFVVSMAPAWGHEAGGGDSISISDDGGGGDGGSAGDGGGDGIAPLPEQQLLKEGDYAILPPIERWEHGGMLILSIPHDASSRLKGAFEQYVRMSYWRTHQRDECHREVVKVLQSRFGVCLTKKK